MKDSNQIGRRTVLKTLGTGLVGLGAVAGTASGSHSNWFPPLDDRTSWGEAVVFGDSGITQTFVRTTDDGDPEYVGVYVTGWTLNQLPTEGSHIAHFLSLPNGSVFEHVGLDWNPHGHEPPGIYTIPHFDFHFHVLPESTVKSIPGGPATYSLPDELMPEGYIRAPAIDMDGDGQPDTPAMVPTMGEHLVNPASPEFHGETFDHTHIYGAVDVDGDGSGQVHFMEPMITKAFLETQPAESRHEIGMPETFAKSGMYPTEYVIRYRSDQNAYVITMESFEQFG